VSVTITPTYQTVTVADGPSLTLSSAQSVEVLDGVVSLPWLNVKDFGVVGDGVASDETALQAAADAAVGRTLYFPPGTYDIRAMIHLLATTSVYMDPNAVVRCRAVLAGPMFDTPSDTAWTNQFWQGGQLVCNGNAQTGFYPRNIARSWIRDLRIHTYTLYGLIIGDPAMGSSKGYECFVDNVKVQRAAADSIPASSYGIWVRWTTDCDIHDSVITGAETGVRVDTGNNQFHDLHAYGAATNPTQCFDDNGIANIWVNCYADTPGSYGFITRQSNSTSVYIGCRTYNNATQGVDNGPTGFYMAGATPQASYIGCHIRGNDSSHRFAKDFDSASGYSPHLVTITGSQRANVVTEAGDNNQRVFGTLLNNISGTWIAPSTVISTSGSLGIGTLRVIPMYVESGLTTTDFAVDITNGGDSGSTVRCGIYRDNGKGYPGSLLVELGSLAGDAIATPTASKTQYIPPGMYYIGGVVQNVTTTQPTVRTATTSGTQGSIATTAATALQTAQNGVAFAQTGVTGALPATFSSSVSLAGGAPRVALKVQ